MKLGLGIGPVGPPGGERIIELAKEAENLGYDTIWCPEIYGMDCFTPLAWIGMNRWLDDFAFRVDLQWWVFLGAGLITIAIAVGTVSIRGLKAARANPVENIKQE